VQGVEPGPDGRAEPSRVEGFGRPLVGRVADQGPADRLPDQFGDGHAQKLLGPLLNVLVPADVTVS
jgi:hypothetical protein